MRKDATDPEVVVTFKAPRSLVERIEVLARADYTNRSAWLRQSLGRLTREQVA
jgi:hypothetical protein